MNNSKKIKTTKNSKMTEEAKEINSEKNTENLKIEEEKNYRSQWTVTDNCTNENFPRNAFNVLLKVSKCLCSQRSKDIFESFVRLITIKNKESKGNHFFTSKRRIEELLAGDPNIIFADLKLHWKDRKEGTMLKPLDFDVSLEIFRNIIFEVFSRDDTPIKVKKHFQKVLASKNPASLHQVQNENKANSEKNVRINQAISLVNNHRSRNLATDSQSSPTGDTSESAIEIDNNTLNDQYYKNIFLFGDTNEDNPRLAKPIKVDDHPHEYMFYNFTFFGNPFDDTPLRVKECFDRVDQDQFLEVGEPSDLIPPIIKRIKKIPKKQRIRLTKRKLSKISVTHPPTKHHTSKGNNNNYEEIADGMISFCPELTFNSQIIFNK